MSHLPATHRRAFSLGEMVVVMVLLGVLAALAVPTLQNLVAAFRDRSVELTLEAVHHDAAALAVSAGRTSFTDADVRAALAELPGFVAAEGFSAWAFDGDGDGIAETTGEMAYDLSADGATVGFAVVSVTGSAVFSVGTVEGAAQWSSPSPCLADAVAAIDAEPGTCPEYPSPTPADAYVSIRSDGLVRVRWLQGTYMEAFAYSYTLHGAASGSGSATSGLVVSTGMTIPRGSTVTVTFTSQTRRPMTTAVTMTRP
jgi:prepilin-type N-terminal cleavage/methylation domain-containing protein